MLHVLAEFIGSVQVNMCVYVYVWVYTHI